MCTIPGTYLREFRMALNRSSKSVGETDLITSRFPWIRSIYAHKVQYHRCGYLYLVCMVCTYFKICYITYPSLPLKNSAHSRLKKEQKETNLPFLPSLLCAKTQNRYSNFNQTIDSSFHLLKYMNMQINPNFQTNS